MLVAPARISMKRELPMSPASCCSRKTGLLFTVWLLSLLAASAQTATFTNPILSPGPDPWVVYDHGFYYFMCSTGDNLTIRRTRDITDLAHAEKFIVWTPPSTGMWSKEIWAPELHRLRVKLLIYFAADDGANENHRIYVIENDAADPTEGSWSFRGKVADPSDKWAI